MIQGISEKIIPEAYGDCLAIMAVAPKSILPISIIEMHLFSYLACIMSLFDGQLVADWEYRFALTKEGFPFSPQLEGARRKIIKRGLLTTHSNATLSPENPRFSQEINLFDGLASFSRRKQWIKTATECTLALPLGSIRYALEGLPSIREAIKLNQNQTLLQKNEIAQLHEDYRIVLKALEDDVTDPLAPAVVWLSAKLFERNQE